MHIKTIIALRDITTKIEDQSIRTELLNIIDKLIAKGREELAELAQEISLEISDEIKDHFNWEIKEEK